MCNGHVTNFLLCLINSSLLKHDHLYLSFERNIKFLYVRGMTSMIVDVFLHKLVHIIALLFLISKSNRHGKSIRDSSKDLPVAVHFNRLSH